MQLIPDKKRVKKMLVDMLPGITVVATMSLCMRVFWLDIIYSGAISMAVGLISAWFIRRIERKRMTKEP